MKTGPFFIALVQFLWCLPATSSGGDEVMKMDIGQALSNTVSMTFGRNLSLAGLWGVFTIAQLLAFGLLAAVVGGGMMSLASFGDPAAGAGMSAGVIVGLIVFYGLYLLLYGAQSIAMTAQASPLLEPNFGRSFSVGLRGALTFFGVMVLVLIAYFIGAFVFMIAGLALSFLDEIGGVILIVIAIPVLIYLACRLMIIPAVIAVEEVYNPINVIRRSWQLTRGNVLGIFVTLVVLMVIFLALFLVLFLVAGSGFSAMTLAAETPSVGMIVVLVIAMFAVFILAAAAGAALVASVHAAVSDSNAEELGETFA